ncbi:MAG: gp53-like domain-containing protein [Candidatus Dormibacteria bacterium]
MPQQGVDSYLTLQVGSTNPAPVTLAFADAISRIRGITVFNASQAVVNLFFNRTAAGAPDVFIPAASSVAIPVPFLQYAIATISNPNNLPGTIYIHYTTELIVSTAGQVTLNFGPTVVAANGYVTLPGGVILQWGSVQNVPTDISFTNIVFPLAFPNAVFSVTGNAEYIDGSGVLDATTMLKLYVVTKSSFDAVVGGGSPNGVGAIRWMATGN